MGHRLGRQLSTLAARQVWDVWYSGIPTQPNQWARFGAWGRAAWLGLTSGGNYGNGLESVKDYLFGGPSVVPPFTLVWHHADVARTVPALDPRTDESYLDEIVGLLRTYGVTVELR